MNKFICILSLLSTIVYSESIDVSKKVLVTEVTKEYETIGYKNPETVCIDVIEESYNTDEPIKKKRNSNYVAIGTGSGKVLISTQNDEYEQESKRLIGGKEGEALASDLRDKRQIHPTSNQRIHREKCQSTLDKRQERVKMVFRNYFYINGVKFSKDSDKPLDEVEVTVTYKW